MASNDHKALPIGIDNFYDIRHGDFCYVDKTYLIQRLLDTKTRAILFSRPRRFGKSLALNMLRRFFDCNEKEKNRPLFEGLAVAQSERYMAEQGKYPVVFLNLKDVKGSTQDRIEEAFKEVLRDAIDPFAYLLRSDKLEPSEKDRLQELLSCQVSLISLSLSLNRLCSLLAKHHGQPVVILIDEYDTPLQSAYINGCSQPICDLMRNLFSSTLKSNDTLRLGVITGVVRIAKDSLFSGLNNLKVDTILSDKYADCFGFTPAEVARMAHEYAVPDKIEEIQAWYDGYRFGNQDIYNPWSVIQYFDEGCQPQAYWLDTSSNDLVIEALHNLAETQHGEVQNLYEGGSVVATVDTSVTFPQLQSEPGRTDANTLYSLMAVCGYLKPVQHIVDDAYRLVIPNGEIRKIFAREILRHLQARLRFDKLQELRLAIICGQSQQFATLLNAYILASLSYFDTTEKFYHGWMMGLLFALNEEYVCQSNREAGSGRADIVLKPRQNRVLPGLIFELKHSASPEQLPEKAAEALKQMEERRYVADFSSEVREVLGYGIAFCQKQCEIAQRTWQR